MAELRGLDAVGRQVRMAADAADRPWPLPDGAWAQAQTRRDLLLACWPADVSALARLVPPELALDTFAGEAWVGVACSRVAAMRVRGLPPLPGLSSFPQVEVGTYVIRDGRPGVWLFSVDMAKPLLAEAAKRTHRLPAYRSRIAVEPLGAGLRYDAVRDGARFAVRFSRAGEPAVPGPGTLERFVVERYALYTADGGRLYRAELHHRPIAVCPAEGAIEADTLLPSEVAGAPVLLAAAEHDVLVWPLEEV